MRKSGYSFNGNWLEDKQQGEGKEVTDDGTEYEGTF